MNYLYISLNIEQYKKQFGELPLVYLNCCITEKIENTITITELDKYNAIKVYLSESKFEDNIIKRFNVKLFNFELL